MDRPKPLEIYDCHEISRYLIHHGASFKKWDNSFIKFLNTLNDIDGQNSVYSICLDEYLDKELYPDLESDCKEILIKMKELFPEKSELAIEIWW